MFLFVCVCVCVVQDEHLAELLRLFLYLSAGLGIDHLQIRNVGQVVHCCLGVHSVSLGAGSA
jgi:hypothetical protein